MNNQFVRHEKIRFQHIDQAGIVFYPRYLEMLNSLVEDWFAEELGMPFRQMHETHGIPTVDLHVRFKSPARLGDTITKKLWVNELGDASIKCGFWFGSEEGRLHLEGEVTLVFVAISADRSSIRSEALPKELRQKIQQYLIKTPIS